MVENLAACARVCEQHGFTLLLEPFNTRVDHPDYFLDSPAPGRRGAEGGGQPGGEDAVRHLPHADHGRQHHRLHPREPALDRPLPPRRRARPPRAGRPASSTTPSSCRRSTGSATPATCGLEYWPTVESGPFLARTQGLPGVKPRMKVAVIGGTGHVGTYLVPRLVEGGHEVTCVTRGSRAPYLPHPAWKAVRMVALDREQLEAAGRLRRAGGRAGGGGGGGHGLLQRGKRPAAGRRRCAGGCSTTCAAAPSGCTGPAWRCPPPRRGPATPSASTA